MAVGNKIETDGIVIPILALVTLDGKPILNKKLRSVKLIKPVHYPPSP
jgi:hypothetical protein